MRRVIEIIPFFLIFGTLGLLIDEFLFDWGRVTTLIFAVSNISGLIILYLLNSNRKKELSKK